MGLWWTEILSRDSLNNIGLTEEYIDDIYLQIENNIIAIKCTRPSNGETDTSKIKNVREQLNSYLKTKFELFHYKKFRDRKYITIGFIEYDEINFEEKLLLAKNALTDILMHNFRIV